MSARDLPYGAAEIIALRSSGKRPADLVLVSFLGPLRESNPVIIAKAERAYDWRVLVGLSVAVIIESNTPNLAGIVKAIVAAKPGSLSVWFADRQDGVNVSLNGYRPATKSGRRMDICQRVAWAGIGTDKPAGECCQLIARQAKCRAMVNADRFDAALVEMAQAGFRRIFGKAWEAA
ncbi:MAG: hypothetical protein WBJ68_13050 [Candidatus Dechloromonas phosphoritropha]|nr:hypothetical protein [Candidatus Dechloromonas phosphoritropha]